METVLFDFSRPWRLTIAENAAVVAQKFDPTTPDAATDSGFLTIPATVPGNFELDLFRAGLAPDPYFGTNPWVYQQYENRHLYYSTTFDAVGADDRNTFLVFGGIDTYADIFVNGEKIAHTENMLTEQVIPVKGLCEYGNALLVHIYPTAIESRRQSLGTLNYTSPYNMGALGVRKAPSMFGWDIMPRFLSGGIWKSVRLVRRPSDRIEDVYFYNLATDPVSRTAQCGFFWHITTNRDDLRDLRLCLEGKCGESVFLYEINGLWHTYGNDPYITVTNAALWYPRNAGEQPLYDVTVRLLCGDTLLDEVKFRHGIAEIRLDRTSTTDKDGNGKFEFHVNGRRVFLMGTNWVPLDAFPSRHAERLMPALAMADDLGCNIIRCWGGNVYENDAFYDFCDEHGILVWQDFAMACGIYPQDDAFADVLRTEAEAVVRRLRNHVSLALWAGDNECDGTYRCTPVKHDPNKNRPTRMTLREVVRIHDPYRPYLPSSPYMDETACRTGMPLSEDHLWGPRDYFKGEYYRNTVAHFASETGYHGCPSPSSLRKFIPPDALFPPFTENGDVKPDWLCHAAAMENNQKCYTAYRIPLMDAQVRTLFGHAADNLDDYARQSQISQAEAKKYFIERFRLSKWRRTGIIWWNLIDGWPQISDAVVDWYGMKKLAYHFIRRSQAPLCLMFDEPADGKLTLYAVNDLTRDRALSYTVTDLTDGRRLAAGNFTALSDTSLPVCDIPAPDGQHFLLIEWESNGDTGRNHFSTCTRGASYRQYTEDLRKAGMAEFSGFGE